MQISDPLFAFDVVELQSEMRSYLGINKALSDQMYRAPLISALRLILFFNCFVKLQVRYMARLIIFRRETFSQIKTFETLVSRK